MDEGPVASVAGSAALCLAGGFWSGGIVENRGEQSLGMAIPVPQGVKGGTDKIPITIAPVQFQVAKTKHKICGMCHMSGVATLFTKR